MVAKRAGRSTPSSVGGGESSEDERTFPLLAHLPFHTEVLAFRLLLYSCVHMYRYSCMRAGARRIPLVKKFLFASRNAPRAPWMRDSGIRGRAGGEIMHSTPRGHIFLKSHMHRGRGAGGGRCRRLTLLIRRPAGRCRPRPRSSVRPTPDLAPADWRLCTGARRDGCCTPRLDARS